MSKRRNAARNNDLKTQTAMRETDLPHGETQTAMRETDLPHGETQTAMRETEPTHAASDIRPVAGAFDGPTVTIEIPICRAHQHPTSRLDMHLSPDGARALRDVQDGLMREHARLNGGLGTHVETGPDAVRWIMEQVACAICEASTQGDRHASVVDSRTSPTTGSVQ